MAVVTVTEKPVAKKQYVAPEVKVYKLVHQSSLMNYSNGYINMADQTKSYLA